jgi:hypothetical protein
MDELSKIFFFPGHQLSGIFYELHVAPIIEEHYPGLSHSAALLGNGSEVLGYDDELSTDHSWGPRVIIFLSAENHGDKAARLHDILGQELPHSVRGFPTNFEKVPGEPRSLVPKLDGQRPINHLMEITTLGDFVKKQTGLDYPKELAVLDWLTIPEQRLLSLTAGEVYRDGLNVLELMRSELAYYPHDVWLYLLSAQWNRIGQEEPFMGRAGSVMDDLGSAVIAGRLVGDIIRLCFLMEKEYAPYSKWFGSAFFRIPSAQDVIDPLKNALKAENWRKREEHLSFAYRAVAQLHNSLGITAEVPTDVSPFYERPFQVLHSQEIARAIWDTIEDEEVKALPYGLGKIDQISDNTDVLSYVPRFQKTNALYG